MKALHAINPAQHPTLLRALAIFLQIMRGSGTPTDAITAFRLTGTPYNPALSSWTSTPVEYYINYEDETSDWNTLNHENLYYYLLDYPTPSPEAIAEVEGMFV